MRALGRKAKVTTEKVQEINRLYNNGYNMAEIGKMLNLGHSTVNNYIWKPRSRGSVGKWLVGQF